VTRFPTAKKLVGYAGLGAGVHHSGQSHKDRGVTKQGRRVLVACPGRTGQGGCLECGDHPSLLESPVSTPRPP
jgi:hypothetical protein